MTYADIVSIVMMQKGLFRKFDEVYLFGSILNDGLSSEDVDILVVYSKKLCEIIDDVRLISKVLEKSVHYPIDITALNKSEMNEIKLTERFNQNFLKIK